MASVTVTLEQRPVAGRVGIQALGARREVSGAASGRAGGADGRQGAGREMSGLCLFWDWHAKRLEGPAGLVPELPCTLTALRPRAHPQAMLFSFLCGFLNLTSIQSPHASSSPKVQDRGTLLPPCSVTRLFCPVDRTALTHSPDLNLPLHKDSLIPSQPPPPPPTPSLVGKRLHFNATPV